MKKSTEVGIGSGKVARLDCPTCEGRGWLSPTTHEVCSCVEKENNNSPAQLRVEEYTGRIVGRWEGLGKEAQEVHRGLLGIEPKLPQPGSPGHCACGGAVVFLPNWEEWACEGALTGECQEWHERRREIWAERAQNLGDLKGFLCRTCGFNHMQRNSTYTGAWCPICHWPN